jgi:hypothetical protein
MLDYHPDVTNGEFQKDSLCRTHNFRTIMLDMVAESE